METRVPRERYPWWVKATRFGARGRTAQWFWVHASFLIGLIFLALAATGTNATVVQAVVRLTLLLAGVWGFVAAALYYRTIRWVDSHGTWD